MTICHFDQRRSEVMQYENAQKEIIKILRGMTGKWSLYPLWRDFLVLAACTISNGVDKSQWQKREDMYMQTIQKYEKREANKFAEILALVVTGLSGGRIGDFLGELYMQMEIGNKDVGQFFTPYYVSELMAQLIDVDPDENGNVTLNDPACGSGGLIVAYAETLKRKGVNYQEKLRVICNDLDYDVVKMAYIQLSLLGIDAVIMQGDSITQKMNEVWYTPMHFVNLVREKERKSNDKAKRMLKIVKDLESLEKPVNAPVEIIPEQKQMSIFDMGVM